MADLKFAKIKEGWDVEQTLKFGLSYNTVNVVVRHMKIHAKLMWVHDYINPLQSGKYETWCIANPIKSSCPNSERKFHDGYWINTLEHITQK